MGTYTEFQIAIELKKDTPQEVIDILNYMLAGGDTELWKDKGLPVPPVPDHPLFKCDRWQYMLNASDACFVGATNSLYVPTPEKTWRPDYELFVRSSFKNYDSEIDHFLKWIAPYVNSGYRNYVGYTYCGDYMYDSPVLIYSPGGIHKDFLFKRLDFVLEDHE